jgi:putative acyl-CoA dehydrogenase
MLSFQEKLTKYNTHEVLNQPPALVDYNLFEQDNPLVEAVKREGATWAIAQLAELGALCGTAEVIKWGFEANENPPELRPFNRFGYRIDEVDFHPSYHNLMRTSASFGIHAGPWREQKAGGHVARAAAMHLMSQAEGAHICPISMTYAGIPVVQKLPKGADYWLNRLTSLNYEPELALKGGKTSAIMGMAMTEKQGGSDVRANTTRAEFSGDDEYYITGHKWFCSAPMSDAFLVLAQAPGGLTCFFMPRILPDGTRNRFYIQRLKDKLGNKANASSEVEFDNAWAIKVGEEGRGVPTIIEMVNYTRLDCILGATSIMRQALAQASHHAAYRSAFGKRLIDQPLMQNVLADLALESEAATTLAMRIARACDNAAQSEHEALFKRIGTAISKYWITKRCPVYVGEALECLGGNGYVEESIMPRLFRESPLNSIWEGSGNVNSLDVLRAMSKEPAVVQAYFAEVASAKGGNKHLDTAIEQIKSELTDRTNLEVRARRVIEQMALALQGALLVQYAPSVVAEAFCASRLGGDWGKAFGTLPPTTAFKAIIERNQPKIG